MNYIESINASLAAMASKESATIKSQIALLSADIVCSVTFDRKYFLLSSKHQIEYDENILQEPYSFWHCWQRQIHFVAFKWSVYGLKTTWKVEEPSIVGWTSKFAAALFSSKKEESNSLTMLSLNLASK